MKYYGIKNCYRADKRNTLLESTFKVLFIKFWMWSHLWKLKDGRKMLKMKMIISAFCIIKGNQNLNWTSLHKCLTLGETVLNNYPIEVAVFPLITFNGKSVFKKMSFWFRWLFTRESHITLDIIGQLWYSAVNMSTKMPKYFEKQLRKFEVRITI